MNQVNEKEFLNRLLDIVIKLSTIVRTQGPRFKRLWYEYFKPLNEEPHVVRQIPLEKDKFLKNLDYRISVLKTVVNSLIDGYFSICSLLKTLYNSYFEDSELFKSDFSKEDQLILKYLVARKILGPLVQFNKMEHEIVPLKYNIIAREYLMIKLKGITLEDMSASLKRLNKNVSIETLSKTMEEIKEDGIINIEEDNESYFYTLNKELTLSMEGQIKYDLFLNSLIGWPTGFWRSFYNIRELNLIPNEDVKHHGFLQLVLSKSATQRFSACHFIFKNLVKYYGKIKNEVN